MLAMTDAEPTVLQQNTSTSEDVKQTEQDKEAFQCTVSKPEKVGEGVNAYVTYIVTVKRKADGSTLSIVRRFSDFYWLNEVLKVEFKHILIPPLPEKAIFDRFSPEFVEYRRKELERFLKRVLSQPSLSASPFLNTFLTATETTMDIERNKPKTSLVSPPQPKKEEKGFFASISAGFSSVTSVVTGPAVELKEVDPYFDVQNNYLSNLDQHLQVLVARSNANTKKKQEMVASLTDFAHAASLACGCEVGQDEVLANFWGKLSEILNQMASLTDELVRGETEDFEDQLKDYVRLVGAGKDLLENRQAILLEWQTCQAKTEKLQKTQGTSKAAMTNDMQEATNQLAESEKKVKLISENVRFELETFKQNKGRDLRAALRELVRLNINHQLRVVNLWKELLAEVEEGKF